MQKLPSRKTLLIILVVALIALVIFFGVTLYSAAQTAERETEALTANTITAGDISPYLPGIVEVNCNDSSGGDSGSGSLWNLPNLGYIVLTNEHVIDDDGARNEGVSSTNDAGQPITIKDACSISLNGDNTIDYYIDLASKHQWNKQADAAALPISINAGTLLTPAVADLNYSISQLPLCSDAVPIGSPVVIIGFPAYATAATSTENQSSTQDNKIGTTGIVSGLTWKDQVTGATLQYPDYFTTALTDAGSSGGIALAKNMNGMCVLGIPTLVSQGEYSSAGVIQNIKNVFLKD